MTALAAAAYVAMVWHVGTADVGWRLHDLHWGVVRVLFPFMAGVVVYRFIAARPQRVWPGAGLAVVLSALFMAAICGPRTDSAAYAALFVLVLTPAFVYLGAHVTVPARLRPVCQLLGDLSFPIYIVHQPLLHMPSLVRHVVAPTWWPHLIVQAFAALASIAVAYLLMKHVEPPLRARVARRLPSAQRAQSVGTGAAMRRS